MSQKCQVIVGGTWRTGRFAKAPSVQGSETGTAAPRPVPLMQSRADLNAPVAPNCYEKAAVRGLARCVDLGSPIGSGGKHGPGDRGCGGTGAFERGARGAGPVEEMGTVPQREAVGHGPRGLQRGRQRLELLHPRPGTFARLPVGRGRARRIVRRQAAVVLRAGVVERARPDPQGAPVRAHQQRGQPRRGCEGVLLLPR